MMGRGWRGCFLFIHFIGLTHSPFPIYFSLIGGRCLEVPHYTLFKLPCGTYFSLNFPDVIKSELKCNKTNNNEKSVEKVSIVDLLGKNMHDSVKKEKIVDWKKEINKRWEAAILSQKLQRPKTWNVCWQVVALTAMVTSVQESKKKPLRCFSRQWELWAQIPWSYGI